MKKVFTGSKAIIKIAGRPILWVQNMDYSSRWANKYAIRTERLVAKYPKEKILYSAVYKLYQFLDKLNVRTGC